MIAKCPSDPGHRRFRTTVSIGQEWEVAPDGHCLQVVDECSDVIEGPDPKNLWTCAICGSAAMFVEGDDHSAVDGDDY